MDHATIPQIFPENIRKLLQENIDLMIKNLGEGIVGIYVHGSLAMGGFNPTQSDIDYLVVVDKKVPIEKKQNIAQNLVKLAEHAPAKGIEMHIITLESLKDFKSPTPFEFHYSQYWHEAFVNNQFDFTKENEDGDLAAHLIIIEARGVCVYGKPIQEVFPKLPMKYYEEAILSDVQNAREDIVEKPVYFILNLCRVLVYFKDHKITSKIEGGTEALDIINSKYQILVKEALDTYLKDRQKLNWDKVELKKFADYMLKEIGT